MRLEVRPWEMEDAYDLRNLLENTKEIRQWFFTIVYPNSFLRIANRIHFYQCADPERFLFRAIVVEDKVCGYIQCEKRSTSSAELSYYLDSAYRHNGIMKKAIYYAMEEAFSRLDVISVYARVKEHNENSKQLLYACNFQAVKLEDMYIFTKYK